MEELSQIVETRHLPVTIKILPYLLDHQFEGKPVLPAVEAMQILAVSTRSNLPDANINCILNARFDKFFPIRPDEKNITAINEIEVHEDGHIISKLITKSRLKRISITRIKEHVILNFKRKDDTVEIRSFDRDEFLQGNVFEIPSNRVYSDLVPFGPAYHNVKDMLCVFEKGAVATVDGGKPESLDELDLPLGSPFPLDAAFHVACVWGQRYSHVVAFPVGLKERYIFKPTRSGEIYSAVVIPVQPGPDLLIFDIWIFTQDGELCESALGGRMRDVSSGRIKPPPWITI